MHCGHPNLCVHRILHCKREVSNLILGYNIIHFAAGSGFGIDGDRLLAVLSQPPPAGNPQK